MTYTSAGSKGVHRRKPLSEEHRRRISTSGKLAASKHSPETLAAIAKSHSNRTAPLKTIPVLTPPGDEDRLRIQAMPLKQRREYLHANPVLCEVCGVRFARNILAKSLVACCVQRADKCAGRARPGMLCFGCGGPSTRKTRSGLVCGSNQKLGCQKFADKVESKRLAACTTSMEDPAFRERVQQRHDATMLSRYGVRSSIGLNKWKDTMMERYGVINPSLSAEIQVSTKLRIQAKYGVGHTSQLESTKEAFRMTSQARYGVDNPSSSPELRKVWEAVHTARHGVHHPMMREVNREKHRAAFMAIYGVSSSMAIPGIQARCRATLLARYGVENCAEHPLFIRNRRDNLMEKYGVESVFQLESVKLATIATNQANHGVDHHSQRPDVLRKMQSSLYSTRTMTLPSGRSIQYQGYEDRSILHQITLHAEDQLGFNNDLTIPWIKKSGKMGSYFPDITISHINSLIEVKSAYTFTRGMEDGTLPAKMLGCIAAGWNATIEVWGPTGDVPDFEITAESLLEGVLPLSEAM